MKLTTIIAAAVVAVSTSMANAATYSWSYLFDNGNLLSGSLEGTLQADNDTIIVSSVFDVEYLSVTYNSLIVSNFGGGSVFVTISGASMGLCADDVGNCSGDGFILDTDPNFAFTDLPNGVTTADDGTFDRSAWNIEVATQVPLPASALLLLSGIGFLGFARRRRQV